MHIYIKYIYLFVLILLWRPSFDCRVHILLMCGPSTQGTDLKIPDTRVQAEAVVQCRVDKQCSYQPLHTLHT